MALDQSDFERVMRTDSANESAIPFKNKITIENMANDYTLAKKLQSDIKLKVIEYRNLKNIEGNERIACVPGRSQVSTPLVRRQAEWRYPALSEPFNGAQKLFTVNPRTWESVEAARQNSILLNYQFETEIDKVKFIDEYVRRNVDDGFAIIRTGWVRNETTKEFMVPTYDFYVCEPDDVDMINMVANALMLYNESPKDFDKLPPEVKESVLFTMEQNKDIPNSSEPILYYAVQTGEVEQEITQILRNAPTVDLVDIDNFLIDPSAKGNVGDAMFCIFTYRTTLSDLRAQGDTYTNLDLIDPNALPIEPMTEADLDPANNLFSGKNRDKLTVTEYWAKWDVEGDGNLKPIVVSYIGDVIIRCELNPFPDQRYPFEISVYSPLIGSVFGEPDAPLIADNQRISGALTRAAIDIIGRSANAQTAIPKGAMDAVNRAKYERGDDFEYNPGNGDIRDILTTLTTPEVPASLIGMINQQSSVVESLTGIKSFGEGMNSGSLGDVAAGIKGVLDAAAKREVSILRRLASCLARVGAKIIAMNKVYLSDQEVVRITNETNNQVTVQDNYTVIYRDQLQGTFDVSVVVTTAEEDNMKAQQIAVMLQTMGNTIDFRITVQLLAQFAELRGMPDIAKQLREYEPEPDPMQEINLAKAEAEAKKISAEAELKMAQARYYNVLSDKAQLDFVEQDMGVKHARDVEKITSQAESQAVLAEKKFQLDLLKDAMENARGDKNLTVTPSLATDSALLPEL